MTDKPTNEANGGATTVLDPGTALITPLDERTQPLRGSLISIDVGDSGLAVTARAKVPRTAYLGMQRVWVMARHDGGLTSFQGLARQTEPSLVELTGISAPVEEHRRAFPRASVDLHCHLRPHGTGTGWGEPVERWSSGTVVDLSRRSCRLQVPPEELPDTGTQVEVVIDLDGEPIAMFAAVNRTEAESGNVVLTFLSLSEKDAARIDRLVLSRVIPEAS